MRLHVAPARRQRRQKAPARELQRPVPLASLCSGAAPYINRFSRCRPRRELRQYLDEGGVLDAWSKCLVAIYQEKEKPEQPIE